MFLISCVVARYLVVFCNDFHVAGVTYVTKSCALSMTQCARIPKFGDLSLDWRTRGVQSNHDRNSPKRQPFGRSDERP